MVVNILYFGNFNFPYGNAAGARVLGNGKSLREAGHNIVFVDLNESGRFNISSKKTFDGFICHSLPSPTAFDRLFFWKYFLILKEIVKKEKIQVFILYGNPVISFLHLLLNTFCAKNKIKFVVDVADWHSANSGNYFIRLVKLFDIQFRMKYLNCKSNGVITISSYLRNFYLSKGKNAVLIPPLIDKFRYSNLKFNLNFDRVNLIYVGYPFPNRNGRSVSKSAYKDRLDIIIESLFKVKNRNFIFDIYGISKEEYLKVINFHRNILTELKENIVFHGKVENSKALQYIANADFSILFRENNRLSNSGFPTKFVESISCGTPMLTTYTSDLERYLSVDRLGFGVSPEKNTDFIKLLEEILSFDKAKILFLKKSCFEYENFSFQKYSVNFNHFITQL
ncbi:glycosyltransferase [Belliella sp. DSM 107340]|uniref:Glycosyltransferase n=1 Tax=Belliella calami TaxID=2923436 RepID=A0ABS9UP72_9BACT|nr:glycosyltransferase [Belliella calami]MCH7398338.1 glycosyltransferase [Belliella calami]